MKKASVAKKRISLATPRFGGWLKSERACSPREQQTPPEGPRKQHHSSNVVPGVLGVQEAGPVPGGPYLSSTSGSNFRVDLERLFLANCTLTFEVTIFESFEVAYILGPLMSCIP